MPLSHVDGPLFRAMVRAAAQALDANREAVNALNVFPVPDGDTGTNMALTMAAAVREVEREAERAGEAGVGQLAQALAQGSLMGARGNSGVILSQLFRGFARYAAGRAHLSPRDLARALQEGVDTAYRAVMKPVEGTILTVAREAAAAALEASRARGAGVAAVLDRAADQAEAALARTPDLLPVLKKAGVVDSGGKGYTVILRAWAAAAHQAAEPPGAPAAPAPAAPPDPALAAPPPAAAPAVRAPTAGAQPAEAPAAAPAAAPAPGREAGVPGVPADPGGRAPYGDESPATRVAFRVDEEISHIPYPYDTEFFIRGRDIPLDQIAARLQEMGDSVYVVGSPELAKVHIHTANPGPVLDYCIRFGELIRIEIHNMREQHADLLARAAPGGPAPAEAAPGGAAAPAAGLQAEAPGGAAAPAAAAAATVAPEDPGQAGAMPAAVVAVAAGPGLEAIFRSLGASAVVHGGQTMNPSTQDILDAIAACRAPVVYVLPNNKNILLTAQQAAALAEKEVYVVPSRSIPQGIAALVAWRPELDPERNLAAMAQAMDQVQTGEVTFAVRDATCGEVAVRAGDRIGLWNGQIVAAEQEPEAAVLKVLEKMVAAAGGEVITLYYGAEVPPDRAEALAAEVRRRFPAHEVEVHAGGQPLYDYVFSLE